MYSSVFTPGLYRKDMGVFLRCSNEPEYTFKGSCSAYPERRDRPTTVAATSLCVACDSYGSKVAIEARKQDMIFALVEVQLRQSIFGSRPGPCSEYGKTVYFATYFMIEKYDTNILCEAGLLNRATDSFLLGCRLVCMYPGDAMAISPLALIGKKQQTLVLKALSAVSSLASR